MTDTLVRPTRRTLVRSAAWSVPVVSLAAMAPAFAASKSFSGLVGGLTAQRYSLNSKRHIAWDLTLTNGADPITSVSIVLTYVPTTGNLVFQAFEVYGYQLVASARDTTWGGTQTGPTNQVTATHGGIAANSTTLLHTDFTGSDNSPGPGTVTAVATFTYSDGSTNTATTSVTWGDGAAHTTHPA